MKAYTIFQIKKGIVGFLLIFAGIILGASPANSQNTFPGFGNVGIGTTTPVTKLEVFRNDGGALLTRFTNGSGSGDRTALIDILNGDNVLWRYGVGGTGNGIGINAGQFYIERGGLGATFTIATNGNVGIGTVTPEQKLHVNGNEILSTGDVSGFKFRNRGSNTSADDWVWYSFANVARFWRAGVGDLIGITTGGNVGIGTTAPQQSLHVVGTEILSTGFQSGFKFRNRNSNSNADDWVWYSDSNIARFWRAGKGDILGINTSGDVGIGTVAPTTRLDVVRNDGSFLLAKFRNTATVGDRSTIIDIQNGNTTPSTLWRYGVGGTGNGLGLISGQFYIERLGIGNVFTIARNGNFGMGTNPLTNFKLAVCGRIRATGVVVNTGWCDYVFEKDYDLKPLLEVEKYIKENKHLPDVPSAAEVEKNGIELGEMNATLLRKIEELTLHMIDLKKDNDLLKSRLDQLTTQASQK